MKRIFALTVTLLIGVGTATAQSPDCCCPHWAKTASLTGASTSTITGASTMSTQEALDWIAKLKEQQEQELARLKHQRAMRRKQAAKLKANRIRLYAPKSSLGMTLLLPAGEPACPPLVEPKAGAILISDFRGCPQWYTSATLKIETPDLTARCFDSKGDAIDYEVLYRLNDKITKERIAPCGCVSMDVNGARCVQRHVWESRKK